MDLSKLEKAEAVAARVYLRKRRKAWDHFFFMQELKVGKYLTGNNGIYYITAVDEAFDASPLDIVITCEEIKTNKTYHFGFSIRAFESDFMTALLRWHNKGVANSYEQDFKINEEAELLYAK